MIVNFVIKLIVIVSFILVNVMRLNWDHHMIMNIIIIINFEIHNIVD